MSYAASLALQEALYARLANDPALAAEVGDAIYDAVPEGALPDLYVALGPERVRDRSDVTGAGSLHDVTISVITTAAGFARAKRAAGAVTEALDGARPVLSRGRLVGLAFRAARARRMGDGSTRRIDITFRARLADA